MRYIERVLGIPIEEIENKILTEQLKEQYECLGNGTYSVNGGEFKVAIKNNTVLSVLN